MKPRHTAHGSEPIYQSAMPHKGLLPMARPGKDEGIGYEHLGIWDKQPSIWTAVAWSGVLLVVGVLLIVAVS